MIVSHRNRYIFMHCRKAAGTSITVFLARYHGVDDIQVGAWHHCYEAGIRPNRRFWLDLAHWRPVGSLVRSVARGPRRTLRRQWIRTLNEAHKARYRPLFGGNPSHPPAMTVRAFDPVSWESYFKFCFVRNPYERVVSDYLWRRKVTGAADSFREFLVALNRGHGDGRMVPENWDNSEIYTIDGALAVDFVGRVEDLEADMAKVVDQIGLPAETVEMPRSRARSAADRSDYREWYGPEERRLVERIYGDEIERFGYSF